MGCNRKNKKVLFYDIPFHVDICAYMLDVFGRKLT